MPCGSVFPKAPKFPTYDNLVKLKRNWGVSIAALAYRLHGLRLVTDWQFRGLYMEISKRGKDREPNSAPRETSVILKSVLNSLYEDGISRSRIAEELTIPTTELEQLLFGLTMTGIVGVARRIPTKRTELSRVK